MLRRTTFVGFAALLALTVPTVAWAEDELPTTSRFFEEYDTNADGVVTKEEFRGAGEVFKLLDKNGDGSIKPDELGLPADYRPDPNAKKRRARNRERDTDRAGGRGDRRRGGGLMQRIARMDADKDGKVTREEWQGQEAMFDRLDRNKDGVLNEADGGGDRRGGQSDRGGLNAERFQSMDKDGDGKISREEWTGPSEAFDRMDRDKSGTIEKTEARGRGQRGGGRGGRGGGRRILTAEQIGERFQQMDANLDGKITEDEFRNERQGRFMMRMDKDEDGAISADEFKSGFMEMQKRTMESMFRRFDRDGDGKVSADEFPGSEDRFNQMDRNGDGFLSPEDLAAVDEPKAKPKQPAPPTTESADLIKSLDKDGDGRLNRAEFTGSDDAWKLLDKNNDGWITKDEASDK